MLQNQDVSKGLLVKTKSRGRLLPSEFVGIRRQGRIVGREKVVQKTSDGLGKQTDSKDVHGKGFVQCRQQLPRGDSHHDFDWRNPNVRGNETVVQVAYRFGQQQMLNSDAAVVLVAPLPVVTKLGPFFPALKQPSNNRAKCPSWASGIQSHVVLPQIVNQGIHGIVFRKKSHNRVLKILSEKKKRNCERVRA